MLTNPSTLGLFDEGIEEIERIFHGAGRAHVLRRREPERRLRDHAARRHGLRRRAHQPAQDVLAAARRRRARAAGRSPCASILEPYLPVAAGRPLDGRHASGSTTTGRSRSAACAASRARSASSSAPTRTSARTGPTLREMSETAVLNANYLLALLQGRVRACRTTGSACTSSCSRRAALEARARRHGARRRQAADGLRLPPADGLLPARRRGGADDRADRDRGEGDARRVRRRDARDRARGGGRARSW